MAAPSVGKENCLNSRSSRLTARAIETTPVERPLKSTPSDLAFFINQVCDPSWEPGLAEYRHHLAELHRIIAASGELLEGNLFTEHLRSSIPDEPVEVFRNKRSNYALFCSGGRSLLEIGFNAGHSCLLALTVEKDLIYTGVDIGMHSYTLRCFDYLKSVFGDRVRLHIGDSRDVIPILRRQQDRFDLYHLDGGHGFNVAHADLCNLLDFAGPGTTLMVDDTNDHLIDGLCDYYVLQGQISPMQFGRLWKDTIDHKLFRVNGRPQP